MSDPLYITILWHMHQPYYKDPLKGEYALPWTYLHAIKDYYDMAAIVADTPGAKAVFNLVPSLLEQIDDYASGRACDPFLIRGQMPPSAMGEDDRLFLLENFFSANRQRMIEPSQTVSRTSFPCRRRGQGKNYRQSQYFKDQDLLDLQVWFFLSWTGEVARRHYPALQELIRKGEKFYP